MKIKQINIAAAAGITPSHLNQILWDVKKRPSWKVAKRLAKITGTTPEFWLDSDKKDIRLKLGLPERRAA